MTPSESAVPTMQSELGCVTGRFQPPHEGHLDLIQLALTRHDSIAIGITNPDQTARHRNDASVDRHLAAANPFTYFERALLLRALMRSQRVDPGRYIIVPFPLGSAATCPEYVPTGAVQYVRVYSEWELRKAELLGHSGYRVHVIQPESEKDRSASTIRAAMTVGDEWREMVPAPTVELLDVFLAQRPMLERRAR